MTGNVLPPGGTKSDLGLIKYRPSGSRAWLRTYDGAAHGNDDGIALVCDRAGNVYVGGYVDRSTGQDFLLIKYDSSGHRKWVRTYDGAAHGDDRIAALAVDAKGSVYAAGRSDGSGSHWDAALVKWTAAGRRAWVRRYNGAGNDVDEFRTVTVDAVRERIYAGGVTDVNATTKGWLLARYSTAGRRAWAKVFSSPDRYADSSGLALTPGGAVLQAGSAGAGVSSKSDALLARYGAGGALAWSDGFSAASEDNFFDLAVDRHGAIFTVGKTWNPVSNWDALICRFTPGGTLGPWLTIGSITGDESFTDVACSAAGNVYATGTWDSAPYGYEYLTESFTNDLDVRWQKITREHDVDWSDIPADIAVRSGTNAGVYVTGRGSQAASLWDWLTIKYKP